MRTLDDIQQIVGSWERAGFTTAEWLRLASALYDLTEIVDEEFGADASRARNYARALGRKVCNDLLPMLQGERAADHRRVGCLFAVASTLHDQDLLDKVSFGTLSVLHTAYVAEHGLWAPDPAPVRRLRGG